MVTLNGAGGEGKSERQVRVSSFQPARLGKRALESQCGCYKKIVITQARDLLFAPSKKIHPTPADSRSLAALRMTSFLFKLRRFVTHACLFNLRELCANSKLETRNCFYTIATRNCSYTTAISGFCFGRTSPIAIASTPARWSSCNSLSASDPATAISRPPAVCGS